MSQGTPHKLPLRADTASGSDRLANPAGAGRNKKKTPARTKDKTDRTKSLGAAMTRKNRNKQKNTRTKELILTRRKDSLQ